MESSLLQESQETTGLGRNYGIDLLRLVFMFMVCILHTLGQGGVLDASVDGTIGYQAYWFLEILSLCAADGFAFISGYAASNRPQKFEKLVNMWFQVFFYSFILTAVLTVVGINDTWTIKDIIKCAFPVTFNRFWYFTAFFVLFFAIPVLNMFLFSVSENVAKKSFIILNYSRHPIQWYEAIRPNAICSISSQKCTRPPKKGAMPLYGFERAFLKMSRYKKR